MPDREPHPFVRLFAAQQQRELDVARETEDRETMARTPDDEYDVVVEGRLDAPPVQEQFSEKAPDQVVEPEREVEPVEAIEERAPEAPRFILRPPFALEVEQETPAGPADREQQEQQQPCLAQRRRLAQEKWKSLERGALTETFRDSKLRTLAERRFNAAAKDLEYGQER